MKKTTKRLAVGAAVAGVAGYVAGILTAPKSGKETREDIKTATSKAITEAEKKLKALHSELSDIIDKAKSLASSKSTQAKDQLNKAIDGAQMAKDKVRDVLSALHEGGADDKDLQKALDEANKAIKHLKTFLKKNG